LSSFSAVSDRLRQVSVKELLLNRPLALTEVTNSNQVRR
jgi:hypothetical protein